MSPGGEISLIAQVFAGKQAKRWLAGLAGDFQIPDPLLAYCNLSVWMEDGWMGGRAERSTGKRKLCGAGKAFVINT